MKKGLSTLFLICTADLLYGQTWNNLVSNNSFEATENEQDFGVLNVMNSSVNELLKSDPNDSVRCNCNFLFLQLGGVPTIFNLGYGREFNSKHRFSFEPMTGVGLGFFESVRPPYYNLEYLLKFRTNYNFHRQHNLFMEVGAEYVFNPWYIGNKEKYYAGCDNGGVCPDTYFLYFGSLGYQFSIKKFSVSIMLFVNYYQSDFYPIPAIDVKYIFK